MRDSAIFSDQTDNYRVRPEPETFIRVLDQAATGEVNPRETKGLDYEATTEPREECEDGSCC